MTVYDSTTFYDSWETVSSTKNYKKKTLYDLIIYAWKILWKHLWREPILLHIWNSSKLFFTFSKLCQSLQFPNRITEKQIQDSLQISFVLKIRKTTCSVCVFIKFCGCISKHTQSSCTVLLAEFVHPLLLGRHCLKAADVSRCALVISRCISVSIFE